MKTAFKGKLMMKNSLARSLIIVAACALLAAGFMLLYEKTPTNVHAGLSQEATNTQTCQARADEAAALNMYITGQVAAVQAAENPQYAGALAFSRPDGARTSLAEWEGKTVLLNLWATWCAPCRAEMPMLSQLQEELGGEDFEVVAVNLDRGGPEKPKAFLAEIGVDNLAFYHDKTSDLFNEIRIMNLAHGLPATLVVDPHGCRLAHLAGPAHWASDEAKALLRAVMEGGA